MKLWVFILTAVVFSITRIRAQSLEYRFSFVDEGTLNKVRIETPLNYQNRILPQSTEGNLGTTNLFLGYGGLTTSLNLDVSTNNLKIPEYSNSIRELSMDLSLTDELDITIGKKILKWGPGYAFNPTGVVEPQRSPSDPSDRLGQNDGRKLISANAFFGGSSITFVYINDARFELSKLSWGKQELALRAYTFVDGFDLSIIGHYKEGDRLETGLNWSKVIGSNLELHGEVLAKKGSSTLYHQIITSDNDHQIFTSNPYVTLFDQSDRIFYKILLGGQYTFENGINIVLEYYHDAEGLDKLEWQRWLKFIKFQNSIQQGSIVAALIVIEASRNNILWALQTLSPRGTMSDYIFAREYFSTGSWSFEYIQFLNTQDFSFVIIPSITFGISENVSLYSRLTSFIGSSDSEFGALFNSCSFNLGIRLQL
jgi:hypothetical protein